ncbi:MAG TPA: ABC transporter substrate-binding protein, partial [Burkholderiaceae bacterium]
FLYALTLSSTDIVPVEAVRMYKERLSVTPVGTGPFMATGPLDRKGTLRLVRNPGYYRTYPSTGAPGDAGKGLLKDAGRRLPFVDVLELPLIEEPQPAALKFLRGELDRRELDRANFTRLVARAPDGTLRPADGYAGKFTLASEPGGNAIYISVNMRDPVLGRNKALRQAIAAAIDPQSDIDVLWNGRGIAMQTLVPVELAGSAHDTAAPPHKRDVALARKLLAQAGFPDGKGLPPLAMRFPSSDAATRNEFDFFKAQLAAIGVQLTGDFDDTPTFTKALDAGNFQLASYSYYADYPDAEDFYQMLYGRNVSPGPNYGAFANAAYDKAYEASRYMVNGPKRFELFRTMDAIVRDEVPLIPLRESLRVDTVQPWVANYKRNVFTTEMQFMRVDMAAKRKGP